MIQGRADKGITTGNELQWEHSGIQWAAWIRRDRLMLAGILLVSTFLYLFRIYPAGYGNLYYAAAVKSMLQSWHNFFYVSFDPGGFVSADKPPLGLWLQTASAFCFGFRGWSLLLPQALAGVLSVGVLFVLVRRYFGVAAALTAAVVLAATPIFVAVNRTNQLDPLLLATLLLAAWAIHAAAAKGKLRWLLVAVLLVGLGFNIKMLEAYMILPACYVIYGLTPRLTGSQKVRHLLLATVLLLVVSFGWVLLVDAAAAEKRPYVGGSKNNSVLSLVFDYNGMERILPDSPKGVNPSLVQTGGRPGPLRLFNVQFARQVGWLLPVALLGSCAAGSRILRAKPKRLSDMTERAFLFWIAWVGPMICYFSITGFFHRYYLCMLAPGLAALIGIGAVEAWRGYRDSPGLGLLIQSSGQNENNLPVFKTGWNGHGWWLPAIMLCGIVWELSLLAQFYKWGSWMILMVFGLGIRSLEQLIRLKQKPVFRENIARNAVLTGLTALLIAPAVWAVTPLCYGDQMVNPITGPRLKNIFINPWGDQVKSKRLAGYLIRRQNKARFVLAVHNAKYAAPLIVETGLPVIAMGGYAGRDPILTLSKLKSLVLGNQVRFFLIPQKDGNGVDMRLSRIDAWIRSHCEPVPGELWKETSDSAGVNRLQLYRYGSVRKSLQDVSPAANRFRRNGIRHRGR